MYEALSHAVSFRLSFLLGWEGRRRCSSCRLLRVLVRGCQVCLSICTFVLGKRVNIGGGAVQAVVCCGFWRAGVRYSVYLLYKYKSTNTDAEGTRSAHIQVSGTHFTCFTSTKVQIVTQKARAQHTYKTTLSARTRSWRFQLSTAGGC